MKPILKLAYIYFKYRFEQDTLVNLVEWGVNRIVQEKGENNLDIILLAGINDLSNIQTKYEVKDLVEKILQTHLGTEIPSDEFFMGKYLEELYQQYQAEQLSIVELDKILSIFYLRLNYPDWMVMLSRNCEYAADTSIFVKPFKDEFNYVAGLWSNSSSLEEFLTQYDRKISNSHDISQLR